MKTWTSIIIVLLASNFIFAQAGTILSKDELLATNAFKKVERIAVNADMIHKGLAPIVFLDYKELIDDQMIDLTKVISTEYMDQSLVNHLYPERADQKTLHLRTKTDPKDPPIYRTVQEMPYLKMCYDATGAGTEYECSDLKYHEIIIPYCTSGTTLLQLHIDKYGKVGGFNIFKNGNKALHTFLTEWTSDPQLFMPGRQNNTLIDVYVTLELIKE